MRAALLSAGCLAPRALGRRSRLPQRETRPPGATARRALRRRAGPRSAGCGGSGAQGRASGPRRRPADPGGRLRARPQPPRGPPHLAPPPQVDLYGFGADSRGNWHHYWENNPSAGAFRKTGVHDADFESNVTATLASVDKIRIFKGR